MNTEFRFQAMHKNVFRKLGKTYLNRTWFQTVWGKRSKQQINEKVENLF